MLYFYDGQIRRYVTQIIRMVSNFGVDDGKGGTKTVPVMYGDLTRQVASIIRDNSENKLPSAPRMAVYVTALELDRDRTSDATFLKKTNIRERAYNETTGEYENYQGKNYTVEKIMPTPYLMRVNVDLWTTSTDQKLQLLEQILVLFNPSLEIQTTDNFIDWTSLTVVHLENVQFTNRSVPIGVDSEIDVATLTFSTPIYISPPAKVKRMGAITNIITSMFDEERGTIDLGASQPELNRYDDTVVSGTRDTEFGRVAETSSSRHQANVNFNQFGIYISGNTADIIARGQVGTISWVSWLESLPGEYRADVSRIFATSLVDNKTYTGTIAINEIDNTQLLINWDEDSFPDDDVISGPAGDRTSIDYIINPTTFNPANIKTSGLRLLLLEPVGSEENTFGPSAWENADGTDLVADANDIVEWNGSKWNIVFDASEQTGITYTTNLNTGVQYRFQNNEWLKSVDGEYPVGTWRIETLG